MQKNLLTTLTFSINLIIKLITVAEMLETHTYSLFSEGRCVGFCLFSVAKNVIAFKEAGVFLRRVRMIGGYKKQKTRGKKDDIVCC
jgi:glycerol-3-phosphate dehydrogenase